MQAKDIYPTTRPSLYKEHGHDHGEPGQEEEGGTAGHSVDHRVPVHHLKIKQDPLISFPSHHISPQATFLATEPVGERPVLEEVEEGRGCRRGDDPVSEDVALLATRGPRQGLLVRGRVTHCPSPVHGEREEEQGVHRGTDLSNAKVTSLSTVM